jgi:hypothetical protein
MTYPQIHVHLTLHIKPINETPCTTPIDHEITHKLVQHNSLLLLIHTHMPYTINTFQLPTHYARTIQIHMTCQTLKMVKQGPSIPKKITKTL